MIKYKKNENKTYNLTSRHIGYCIYCGSKKCLSKEHIVPCALSGEKTLVRASCEICRKITNSFEQPVLRGLFYDYRFLKGLRSRTKMKDFNPIKEYVVKTKDGRKELRKLHLNQVGIHFFLPEFKEPRFITGIKDEGVGFWRIAEFSARPKHHNVPSDISEVKIKRKVPTSDLIRLLCKTGLGYVYLQGLEKDFVAYVTNLILGKSGVEDWKYVGSPVKSKFKDFESGVKLFRKKNLLLAEIKLFEDVVARYLVVLGRVK